MWQPINSAPFERNLDRDICCATGIEFVCGPIQYERIAALERYHALALFHEIDDQCADFSLLAEAIIADRAKRDFRRFTARKVEDLV